MILHLHESRRPACANAHAHRRQLVQPPRVAAHPPHVRTHGVLQHLVQGERGQRREQQGVGRQRLPDE